MPRRDRASERTPEASEERDAHLGEVNSSDAPPLAGELGREEGRAPDERISDFEAEVAGHPLGGRPASDVTGAHDTGNETVDGLDATDEATRRYAEDYPPDGEGGQE